MPKPTNRKAVDTYALKCATIFTAAATIVLAICHHVGRTIGATIAATAFPIIGIAVLASLLFAPIIFAYLYGRRDGYSVPRTITWSWAAGLAAVTAVWTIYGWILISFA